MITPTLTALMCDGMGSFSALDYKRMLLAFDRIFYLLPERLVDFRDVTGKTAHLTFPETLRTESDAFAACFYELDSDRRQMVFEAAKADLSQPELQGVARAIPDDELLYTWRLVNADGSFGDGASIGLSDEDLPLAQLLLFNKYLLAAQHHGAVPITGKTYVHRMLAAKYRFARKTIEQHAPDALRESDLKHGPFVTELISMFVDDEDLAARNYSEIVAYKRRHAARFEEFSYLVRELVDQVTALPADPGFERDVRDVVQMKVWRKYADAKNEMRSAWDSFFSEGVKSAVKSENTKSLVTTIATTAASSVALGVLPQLTAGAMTWASVLALGGAMAPWALSELVDVLAKHRRAKKNGIYYLMGLT